jgi:excisionase family DNA binding protein
MSDLRDIDSRHTYEGRAKQTCSRMSVAEIAKRLDIGRLAVYKLLQQRIIPAIRLGRRWIITRHAYESWERACGMQSSTGLNHQPEVMD